MKRVSRKLSDEVKRKISDAMKGKTKTKEHKEAISKSLKTYWATIPKDNKEFTTNPND